MFERIKMKIIQGRKLKPFAVANVLQDHEDRLKALEGTSSDDTSNTDVENQQDETRNISITVNDGTDAVEGASVAIGTITGTTGSAGGCTLQNVADGEQTITVTATGFEDYSNTITVSENNTSFTISLTESTP